MFYIILFCSYIFTTAFFVNIAKAASSRGGFCTIWLFLKVQSVLPLFRRALHYFAVQNFRHHSFHIAVQNRLVCVTGDFIQIEAWDTYRPYSLRSFALEVWILPPFARGWFCRFEHIPFWKYPLQFYPGNCLFVILAALYICKRCLRPAFHSVKGRYAGYVIIRCKVWAWHSVHQTVFKGWFHTAIEPVAHLDVGKRMILFRLCVIFV